MLRKIAIAAGIAAACCFGQSQPGITRAQADEMLKELRQIRMLLEKQVEAGRKDTPAVALRDDTRVLGNKNAPVTLVEFSDYACGFCRRFHTETFPELKKRYIDTGKVRFASLDFPLDMHAEALGAAVAARCAGRQKKFWEFRDLLLAPGAQLSSGALAGYAAKLGLDMNAFKACTANSELSDAVRKEQAEALALHVEGTPSFLLGKSTPEGAAGALVVGAQPAANFIAAIDALLK